MVNWVSVIVGGVGIVVKMGCVGNGMRSGSMDTLSEIVGAVGIVDETVEVIVDPLVIVGGVGIVKDLVAVMVGSLLTHSLFPVWMHVDEYSWKIQPFGQLKRSK